MYLLHEHQLTWPRHHLRRDWRHSGGHIPSQPRALPQGGDHPGHGAGLELQSGNRDDAGAEQPHTLPPGEAQPTTDGHEVNQVWKHVKSRFVLLKISHSRLERHLIAFFGGGGGGGGQKSRPPTASWPTSTCFSWPPVATMKLGWMSQVILCIWSGCTSAPPLRCGLKSLPPRRQRWWGPEPKCIMMEAWRFRVRKWSMTDTLSILLNAILICMVSSRRKVCQFFVLLEFGTWEILCSWQQLPRHSGVLRRHCASRRLELDTLRWWDHCTGRLLKWPSGKKKTHTRSFLTSLCHWN